MPNIDSSKTFNGPFTLVVLNANAAAILTLTGNSSDKIQTNFQVQKDPMGDGTEDLWGSLVEVIVDIPEVDPSDMTSISQNGYSLLISFPAKPSSTSISLVAADQIWCEIKEARCLIHGLKQSTHLPGCDTWIF